MKQLKPYGILDLEGKYNNPLTGKPHMKLPVNHLNLVKTVLAPLNVYKERERIFNDLHNNQVIIFEAGTGSGKTVAMPLLVLHYFDYQPIICTQPRRNLVDDKTNFISLLLGVPTQITDNNKNILVEDTGLRYVGKKYGSGLDAGWSNDDTKLLWATDAMIKVLITSGDELLEDYNAILIDETHERSIHIDILMNLCAKICLKRPEFKLIIMSATINVKQFQDYFTNLGLGNKTKHIFVEGTGGIKIPKDRILIEDIYFKSNVKTSNRIKTAIKEVDKLLKSEKMDQIFGNDNYENYDNYKFPDSPPKPLKRFFKYGRDILIFAPTMSSIAEIKQEINKKLNSYKYKPLCVGYNRLTSSKTEGLIATTANALNIAELMGSDVGKYDLKVIIATNSAEAGVTFGDPLGFVFETGLQNNEFFRPLEYLYETGIFDIAKDNIMQRRGRTGRINPGICYYMYSKNQFDGFLDYKNTDITQNDITTDILSILNMDDYNSIDTSISFLKDMIEPIDNYTDNIKVAYRNLLDNDFINTENGEINNLGKICSKFGLYGYKVGKLIIMGYHLTKGNDIFLDIILLGAIVGLSLKQFKDLFNSETDSKKIDEMKNKALKNFIHITGDHLSMFKLMKIWLSVPDFQKNTWQEVYNLNSKELNRIKYAYLDLARITLKLLPDIIKTNTFVHMDNYKFMAGGGEQDKFNYMTDLLSRDDSYLLDQVSGGFDEKSFMEGGDLIEDIDIKITDFFNKDESAKLMITKALKNMKTGEKKPTTNTTKKPDSTSKKPAPLPTKKPVNVKELIDIINGPKFEFKGIYNNDSPIKLRNMGNYNKESRMLFALYYALITNVSINKENTHNYYSRYSDISADISYSVLYKYLKQKPKYVIYNKLNKSKMLGNSLSMVSELPEKVINIFNAIKFNI